MNLDFITSAGFIAGFIASLALAFGIMSIWSIYYLDKDDKKSNKKPKLKKA